MWLYYSILIYYSDKNMVTQTVDNEKEKVIKNAKEILLTWINCL